MACIAVTGSASGIGAATADRLRAAGHTIIGVDLHSADVCADLGTEAGRRDAAAAVAERCDGALGALVTSAGIGGSSTERGGRLVSINYFGTVRLLELLRPSLAAAGSAAVVCVSSNSASCQPNWPIDIAEACLAGDEERARDAAEQHASVQAYGAAKAAIAWYVRTHAPASEWAGEGIRMNAVAPGLVETPLTEGQRADPVLGAAIAKFPVPRGEAGRPDEIATVIEFLIGPGASLLYGSIVYADGGTDALLRPRDFPTRWSL